MSFNFQKWYLDAVDNDGRAFVGYAAVMRWNKVELQYHGYLYLPLQGDVQQHNSFRATAVPVSHNGATNWNTPRIRGVWNSVDSEIREMLLTRSDGNIEWVCTQPKAEADVVVHNFPHIRGYGYSECLTMTIRPWDVPIRELRWGRFLSKDHTIIWIEWQGPAQKFLIYHNGTKIIRGAVEDHVVRFGKYNLTLDEARPLRKGTLRSTVFTRFGWVRNLLPLSVLRIEENKWCSRGSLMLDGVTIARGWSIHETVIWQ